MFGSTATQTHCLLLFYNETRAADLDNLSIIGLLAEIVWKAGKLPFGYPNGLLAKIIHLIEQMKLRHSLLDFSP